MAAPVFLQGCTQSSCASRQGSEVRHMKTQRGNRIYLFASAALLPALLCAPVAFGQVFGRISGIAKDPTGSVGPGGSVTATCTETGIRSTMVTDGQGLYAFASLPVGHYAGQSSASGLKRITV